MYEELNTPCSPSTDLDNHRHWHQDKDEGLEKRFRRKIRSNDKRHA